MAFRGTSYYYDDDSDESYEDAAPYHHDDVQYSEYVSSRTDTPGFLASSAQSNTTPGTSTLGNPSEPEKSGRIRVRTRDLERERWEREREIREREKERDKARKRELEEKKRHAKPYIEYYDDSEEAVPKSKKKPSKEGSMPGMTTHSWRRLHGSRDARPFSARALIDIPNKDTISKDNTLGDEVWMDSLLARAGPNMRASHILRHTNLTRTGTPERPERPKRHVVYVEDAEEESDSSVLEGIETVRRYAISPSQVPREGTSDDWVSESDDDSGSPTSDTDSSSDGIHASVEDLRNSHANTPMELPPSPSPPPPPRLNGLRSLDRVMASRPGTANRPRDNPSSGMGRRELPQMHSSYIDHSSFIDRSQEALNYIQAARRRRH